MPLYLKLINLLKTEYRLVGNLPKQYKYTLGQEIINITWELLDLFTAVQMGTLNGTQKFASVTKITVRFDCLKLRIRFLTELNLLSLTQAGVLGETLTEIGKMLGSWRKNV